MLRDSLVARLRARAIRVAEPLPPDEVRARVGMNGGDLELALAFETALGGSTIGGVTLGLDTHRLHPPRDAYDEWLAPEHQRARIQLAYGGPHSETFWLDRRGWIQSIGPLDRLLVRARDLEAFLEELLGERAPTVHHGGIAVGPCTAEDADAFFGSTAGCPIGPGIVRIADEDLDALEEADWLRGAFEGPFVVLSAPRLDDLAQGLAELAALEPELRLVIVDGEPAPLYADPIVTPVCTLPYALPWQEPALRLAIGRDVDGGWRMGQRASGSV